MAEYSTLARPYAKAAFEAALQLKQLDVWSSQLAVLAAITADPKVVELIKSPSLPVQEKAQLMKDLLGDDLTDSIASLIDVLAENRRLTLLAEISLQYEALKAEHELSATAIVKTAFALTKKQETDLAKQLTAKMGRKVTLQVEVDPTLIGGVLIRSGDLVIDGSVRGKLAKLAEAMYS